METKGPNRGFDLVDARVWNREHPDTFLVPSPEAVDAIDCGDTVKLIFEPHDKRVLTERMWVRVLTPPTDGLWGVGELLSAPVDANCPIDYQGRLVFERRHIADIYS